MEETKFGKIKLLYGEPLLGRCAVEDFFDIEILVPGVIDGDITVSVEDGKLTVELEEDSEYCKKFGLEFTSDRVDFDDIDAFKNNGVLYISCRIKDEGEGKPNKFSL